MSFKTVFWISVVTEIFLIAAVSVTSICMRQFLEPFHQGFFKDDQTLMHPYKDSSVTSVMLYTIGFLVPTFVIIVVEFIIIKLRQLKRSKCSGDTDQTVPWAVAVWKCYCILCPFYFGAAATHALTNIGKYSVGRLRPHFLDICQPDWSLLNNTSGYIVKDICTQTDEKKMTEARLSFPSGHSSIAMYCAIYFCIYLHKRFTWRKVSLLCPLCQLIIFGTAIYTMMSRIHDFKHHWGDALVGGLLGALIAVLSIWRISHVFKDQRMPWRKKNGAMMERGDPNNSSNSCHDNSVNNTFF